MKRTITVLLVACVLIFSSLTVASASMSDIIAPMADNYRSVYADLKITSGEATVSAKMQRKNRNHDQSDHPLIFTTV